MDLRLRVVRFPHAMRDFHEKWNLFAYLQFVTCTFLYGCIVAERTVMMHHV